MQELNLRGISDERVLAVMRRLRREEFVPPAQKVHAYEDRPLPIGKGQTISQPYIVARMTELLRTAPGQKVLEIGTGSGYQAAVLSQLVGHVYSVERIPELAEQAAVNLQRTGCKNVSIRTGDGYQGWAAHAPYDRIIVTAAPKTMPPALVEQLRAGGVLVAPLGEERQELVVLEKSADGKVTTRSVLPVMFVPMVPGSAPRTP